MCLVYNTSMNCTAWVFAEFAFGAKLQAMALEHGFAVCVMKECAHASVSAAETHVRQSNMKLFGPAEELRKLEGTCVFPKIVCAADQFWTFVCKGSQQKHFPRDRMVYEFSCSLASQQVPTDAIK